MTWSPSSPVTGLAQTGLTSPTYTITADVAPTAQGRQYAVTALGGTQTGVTTHGVSSPFTGTFVKPLVLRILGLVNPITGYLQSVPRNSWKFITRKGVTPLAGQAASTMVITTTMDVPAGADSYDSPNVRAALSFHFGVISQTSSGIGDTVVSGVM